MRFQYLSQLGYEIYMIMPARVVTASFVIPRTCARGYKVIGRVVVVVVVFVSRKIAIPFC